jgi:RimJ/RimL family protein N-acetyltransferase
MIFTIRRALPSDARSIVESINAICAEGGAYYVTHFEPDEQWRMVLDQPEQAPGHFLAVGVVAGAIAGMVNLFPPPATVVSQHVVTLGIHVAAPYRGKGIGSALLDYGLNWAQRIGYEKVVLQVFASNHPARALYQKFGFVEEGVQRRQIKRDGVYDDAIWMARFLGRQVCSTPLRDGLATQSPGVAGAAGR